VGVAVLSSGEDGQGFLPADEPRCACPSQEHPAGEPQTPDEPVFLGGGARPNARFQELCTLAGIRPRSNVETGAEEPWELKDLRKTCATYYDEHLPESSVEILGHSVRGITYRHYAHRAPLAFKAIMTLPQPTAFSVLIHGHDGECPCCRRPFADAG
jgi:hypothetical protein